jgi:hypothetical protein
MDKQFDELSKALTEDGLSRRKALRKLGLSLAGLLLASVGLPQRASAGDPQSCYAGCRKDCAAKCGGKKNSCYDNCFNLCSYQCSPI